MLRVCVQYIRYYVICLFHFYDSMLMYRLIVLHGTMFSLKYVSLTRVSYFFAFNLSRQISLILSVEIIESDGYS